MKQLSLFLGASLFTINSFAQQNPTPNPSADPSVGLPTPQKGDVAWYRGGNLPISQASNKNIFGTLWNSPIYTKTNGFTRTRLNGDLTTVIQGVNQNVSGYLGLSFNPGGQSFFDNNSPRTMLHIDGPNNTAFTGDWRRWMRTGTYYRENSDAMYVGMKQEGLNRSDAVINWSDDVGAGGGPDALRFIFTSTSDGNGGGSTNPRNAASLNGYEYMRMLPYPWANSTNSQGTPIGHAGLGPLFGNTALNSPKARLHSHTEDWFENYFQFSNEQSTGMQYSDGFKIGIGGYSNNTPRSGNAYIYNQENRSILFSTNHVAPSQVNTSPTDAQITEERMRITSISAPTNLNNNAFAPFGVWNPGSLPNQDVTRISISHNPTSPITRPMALLHLGYNTGGPLTPTTTDGWRKWMDVGMFTSNSSDNVYIGLKPELTIGTISIDRQDAVISWGDNYLPFAPGINTGPDKMRVIFTSPATGNLGAGPGAMSTQDGLEFVRYVPFHNTSLNVNDPRTGFGDFNSLLPVGTIDPGNTIEINSIMNGYNAVANTNVTGSYVGSTGASGLRFRDLTSKSLVVVPDSINKIDSTKVLSVDTLGNVVLIKVKGSSGSSIGNICGATANPLTNNWEIPLNNNNFVFTGQGTTNNGVGIGTNCSPVAKLDVLEASGNSNSIGINVVNTDVYATGINVDAQGPGITAVARNYNQFTGNTIGVSGIANNFNSFKANIGVYGEAKNNLANENTGGFFNAATPGVLSNIGVIGYANNARNYNAGGIFHAISSVAGATENKGIETLAWGPSTMPNVALHAFVDPARPQDFAGIFDGAVQINGATTVNGSFTSSDQMFKTNIDTINNALNIINSLKPKQYYYDTVNVYGMRFSSKKQYGLIAQEVEQVLPEMVSNAYQKAQLDTAGHTISQATDYKTVNYNALFGIMVKAIQEQQRTIEVYKQKDSIQDARLTALENAINQCCSNNSARTNNSTTNQLDVELNDKDAIVLNQNVPNPFAEQTTITYNVPVSVAKAQIIFYNGAGQIIQTVDITTRGKGKVNVFANDLSSGLYHYTLVADGKVVDSKKMVRE